MRTEMDRTPPELIINPAIAALAEVSKAEIEPRNEHERRNKDEQRERLMPLKQSECGEGTENDTCANANATIPQPLLIS